MIKNLKPSVWKLLSCNDDWRMLLQPWILEGRVRIGSQDIWGCFKFAWPKRKKSEFIGWKRWVIDFGKCLNCCNKSLRYFRKRITNRDTHFWRKRFRFFTFPKIECAFYRWKTLASTGWTVNQNRSFFEEPGIKYRLLYHSVNVSEKSISIYFLNYPNRKLIFSKLSQFNQ